MFRKSLIKDFSPRRLRNLLIVFFLALIIPTVGLIWQAYSQLKWEAFYQYRGMAEELTRRIDDTLRSRINTAENRSFTDYAFLVVTGDPAANFLQRSPLSDYPVTQDLPGVIGYFQVGANGEFSTPLLPEQGSEPVKLGIATDEYSNRLQLAQEIQQVLADNRLVRTNVDSGMRGLITATDDLRREVIEEERRALGSTSSAPQSRQALALNQFAATMESARFQDSASAAEPVDSLRNGPAKTEDAPADKLAADRDGVERPGDESFDSNIDANEAYSQQIFDQLNRRRELPEPKSDVTGTEESKDASDKIQGSQTRVSAGGKVSDLELDPALQKKSAAYEIKEAEKQRSDGGLDMAPARSKRVEQSVLPEAVSPGSPRENDEAASFVDVRINTFESEVDPYEFSLLDSGHFVLFRKVWRNGDRYIQGLLIDRDQFLQDIVGAAFRSTAISEMSSLVIAYQDDVIDTIQGGEYRSLPSSGQTMEGALLYRSRLSAPLESLGLIYSVNRLPPGPGASVLGWTTIVIAIVFIGGFFALHRMGVRQIMLARQQQDFVSAVSHELKTPLTSIRMYGEMLKEGWADEDKRQQYYGYIHDESERLTRLISNVLQLARITRNEPQFDMHARPVGPLMSQIESKIASQVASAGFELNFERGAGIDDVMVEIDDDCLTQIIINLVDNAIKFSKNAERNSIDVGSFVGRDGSVTFTIRDYGPGVAKDQMKKIFKLFYRSESELTRETVGTGIGLAIVHQLTTAMNGKVDVVNREPGVEFKITFPGK